MAAVLGGERDRFLYSGISVPTTGLMVTTQLDEGIYEKVLHEERDRLGRRDSDRRAQSLEPVMHPSPSRVPLYLHE
jgi:hypothetical protein